MMNEIVTKSSFYAEASLINTRLTNSSYFDYLFTSKCV